MVVETMRRRLDGWKNLSLSFGGRITLEKSVLTEIPIYMLSFYKAPKSIVKTLIHLQRQFIWGGNKERSKIAWVSWDTLCKKKENGGLDIKNLELFNIALLGKWKWRFLVEEEALWRKVMVSKYVKLALMDEVRSQNTRNRIKSIWWRDMIEAKPKNFENDWFGGGVKKKIGDGCSTSFWSDQWVGTTPLKCNFQRLYLLSTTKEAKILEMGSWVNNSWVWRWNWRRGLFQREQEMLEQLEQHLQGVQIHQDKQDSWCWAWDQSGKFSVKPAYNSLNNEEAPHPNSNMFKLLWSVKAPLKMKTLAWKMMLNRMPTKDNLVRRGIEMTEDETLCVFCKTCQESVDHLFFECSCSYNIWMKVYDWFRINTAIMKGAKDQFLQNYDLYFGNKSKIEWRSCWLFVVWSIWVCRNKVLFNEEPIDMDKVLDLIKARRLCWLKANRP